MSGEHMPESSPIVDTDLIEKEVKYNGGTVRLKYRRMTRSMRNDALEAAALAFRKAHPDTKEGGFLPSVFERELVTRMVKWWDLPKPPQLAWDLLSADTDIGDRISEELGIPTALSSLTTPSQEVQDAKNSSQDELSETPIPGSSSA